MRKKYFILLSLIFLISPGLISYTYAQTGNLTSSLEEATTPQIGSESAEQPASAPAKNVTAIEVKGNKAISSNTIISKMKTRMGNVYQENVISDDLKRLYLLGFFSDIKIDTEDYKDGVKIIITVVERPIIEKIAFMGLKHVTMKDEKLKEQLKSKETQYLDYPSLAEDVETLKKLYEKLGFSQAEVTYNADVDPKTNKAKVQFSASEGRKVKIREVAIEGNKAFPDKRILKLMKSRRAWLFNAGALKDEVLKEDIERIKSFYQKEGYADVEVEYVIEGDTKKPLLYITITINEGKKYLVGDVTIEGNKDISEKLILSNLKDALPGKVFSQDALKKDVVNIQSLYFDQGYISCQVQESTTLNTATGRVDIKYDVAENGIAYVDKIKIRGNIKTRDAVIRRELRIKPGDKFDGEKLRRTKERLQNTGFFEEVSYDTENTPVPNKKDLVVEVKEAKTGSFSFGGGYSTVDSFVGFIEVEQKNFDWRNFPYFTGAGQNLKFRASFGSLASGFDLSFTEPWLFDYPVSFGFDAYKRDHKRETDVGYGYDQVVTGGDLRLGRELSEYVRIDGTYRYDTIEISNISDDATDDLRKEVGTNSISSVELALTFDSRDNVFDTRKGDILAGSLQVAGGPFGADKDFWKSYGRASHFVPLFLGSVLEFRGRIGVVKPYGDSDDVPLYERYYAGGAYTIRGYDERRVGPVDPVTKDPLGGEAMLIGNIEYTYPLMSFLKLAAFYDVGNVWAKAEDLGTGNLKSGIGLGVRIKTPIGPVMLDYGIPLNIEPGETDKKSGRLHFSMSHGF